jgi:serine/threonine protein kinase
MEDDRLVLSDFGLAIGQHEETTFHGGTPRYMAPEVVTGEHATQRSDVWQLGMVYASTHDRSRAHLLGEKALAIYNTFQCFDAQKREIADWLSRHGR